MKPFIGSGSLYNNLTVSKAGKSTGLRPKGGGMDAAVTMLSAKGGQDWSLHEAQTPRPKNGKDADFWPRKGLKRKYFFAVPGKKDWSGKPGFWRFWKKAPKMRPNF
jgi:hypothetical protein